MKNRKFGKIKYVIALVLAVAVLGVTLYQDGGEAEADPALLGVAPGLRKTPVYSIIIFQISDQRSPDDHPGFPARDLAVELPRQAS